MNTDRNQTLMGLGEAVLVAGATYLATVGPEGVNYHSPLFWIGMAVAISRGIKGYYAAGIQSQPKEPS